jgi:diadenosine tetraphosphate (Ap4A) HIT family hydrolase
VADCDGGAYDRSAQIRGQRVTNPTARKFGYPRNLVAETTHWLVLVRPQQPTLGSLVLVCKEPATAFSQLTPEAFADLKTAIEGIEGLLRGEIRYAKINYLMLMMVDPDVHFHVIPRYDGERARGSHVFRDDGWPGQPNLASNVALSEDEAAALAAEFAARWRA